MTQGYSEDSPKPPSEQSEKPHTDLFEFKNQDHYNLIQNANKIHYLNLSQNNLSRLPNALLNMFSNIEIIDLSENLFESIHLFGLVRFRSLKEINLSCNMLKVFKPTDTLEPELMDETMDEAYQESLAKLATTLFLSVERINLSNNQLKSQTCLLVSQFKNLKYLNLSNNNFQINSTSAETQLPWQKPINQLKNLIELNLSKNNKQAWVIIMQIGQILFSFSYLVARIYHISTKINSNSK